VISCPFDSYVSFYEYIQDRFTWFLFAGP